MNNDWRVVLYDMQQAQDSKMARRHSTVRPLAPVEMAHDELFVRGCHVEPDPIYVAIHMILLQVRDRYRTVCEADILNHKKSLVYSYKNTLKHPSQLTLASFVGQY